MAPPPREKRSGPGIANRDRLNVDTATAAGATGTSAVSLSGRARTRRYPRADASLYEPAPGRGRFWLSLRCPFCRGVHLCRLRDESQAGGPRRIPCGRVFVVVRQRFRASQGAAA
jgi:hypothetical protein